MYETQTYDKVMSDKMAKVKEVSSNMDTRPGSVVYVVCAPDSLEEAMMYLAHDKILRETFADTATREYLIRRCYDRGITPNPATATVILGDFTYADINNPPAINNGTIFTCAGYSWSVSGKTSNTQYELTCTTTGNAPNYVPIGDKLVPVSAISGLSSATVNKIAIHGEDEESTDALRARYFASFKDVSYRFNRAQIISVVGEQQDVGGVKPFRASKLDANNNIVPNSPGHVAVFITDANYNVPTPELVDAVQTIIDPTQNQGDGLGLAGIDQEIHIAAAKTTTINVASNFTFADGITFEGCKSYIENEITLYLAELNKTWQDNTSIIIRISQIEARLLNNLPSYIIDIANTQINGANTNLTLDNINIAVFGVVSEL